MNKDYLYSSIHVNPSNIFLRANSTVIFAHSQEERSRLDQHLKKVADASVSFIQIEYNGESAIKEVNAGNEYNLKSSVQIKNLLMKAANATLYFDVTGVDNRVCAPVLKSAIECYDAGLLEDIVILYAEPESYDVKSFKSESVFNDLSEQIEGIEPLPGFASIFPDNDEEVIFVALLGFEGGRFTHLLENVQPPRDFVIPVIGVPGFRLEYPFVTYWGNRRPLEETDTWRKMEFAAANSMVEVYLLLSRLIRRKPNARIKLAPIGTKPHAISAILFAIKHFKNVELVYDNPIRKKNRTSGLGRVVECQIGKLYREN